MGTGGAQLCPTARKARKRGEIFSPCRGGRSARGLVVNGDGYLSQSRESVARLHSESDLLTGDGGAIEDDVVL